MLRTTTLLIVMVLAGGPTGSLACALWCTTPAAHSHHEAVGCHDVSLASPTGQHLASTNGCDEAAVTQPFVAEAWRTGSVPVIGTPPAFIDFTSAGPDRNATSVNSYIFGRRPPLLPASPTVLRI